MKKKLLMVLLSTFIVLSTFVSAVHADISTVNDVLSTAGSFPTNASSGWVKQGSSNITIYNEGTSLSVKDGEESSVGLVSIDHSVNLVSTKYQAETDYYFVTFVLESNKLVEIVVVSKAGSSKFDGSYKQRTIKDVLDTVPGGFPESSNAWIGSIKGNIAYKEDATTELFIKNSSKTCRVGLTTEVANVSNNQYKYHDSANDYDILFNMVDNVLTNITFDGGSGDYSSLNDTYKVRVITVTFNSEYLAFSSLQVDGQSTTNYDNIPIGSSVKISVGSIFPDFQLDYFEPSGIEDVTVDGNSISFTMPNSNIGIKFYVSKAISSVDVSLVLPKIGDDSINAPTINPSSNYAIDSYMLFEMSDPDPKPVSVDNKVASGKKYLVCIIIDANQDYAFKYSGTIADGDKRGNCYKYNNINVKVNDEAISSMQSDADLYNTGYVGTDNDDHSNISIYYYFSLYEITEGDNATIDISLGQPAVFRSNADYDKFVKVTVNGSELDSTNYTVTEGSTVVTLKSSYLSTLANGTYDLSIVSTDGYADTQFTITSNESTPSSKSKTKYVTPKTGVE